MSVDRKHIPVTVRRTRSFPDELDVVLLEQLQAHGRATQTVLARLVRRSVPAVSARLRRLESGGLILGYRALLNPNRLNRSSAAFVWIALEDRRAGDEFLHFARRLEAVFEVHAVSASMRFLLKIRTESRRATEAVVDQLITRPGVRDVQVAVVKETHKDVLRVPVGATEISKKSGAGPPEHLPAHHTNGKF